MAFFDVPSTDQIPPESARSLEDYRRLHGHDKVPETWQAYGRLPRVVDVRQRACQAFHDECRFSSEAKFVTAMLTAHARRCEGCFLGSRRALDQLGFDAASLDAMCANPEVLPLDERSRLVVRYALRFATSTPDLTPRDFADMAAHGFSRDEIQEVIALAAYWVMNTMFNTAARIALTDG